MGGNFVRISSRALLELLGGQITQERFNDLHGWDAIGEGEPHRLNPFARFLFKGRMIKRVEIEPGDKENDEWVHIEFGDPHPAISPFVVPKL